MAYFERMRDAISEPFSPEIIRQRTATGWQMVSIEWRRELPDTEAPPDGAFNETSPSGCGSPTTASGSKSIPTRTRSCSS